MPGSQNQGCTFENRRDADADSRGCDEVDCRKLKVDERSEVLEIPGQWQCQAAKPRMHF